MDNALFERVCKQEIIDYVKRNFNKDITEADVYVVWICKTLQNNKALVSTTLLDNMYYEITYDGGKDDVYVDCYKKQSSYTLHLDIVI